MDMVVRTRLTRLQENLAPRRAHRVKSLNGGAAAHLGEAGQDSKGSMLRGQLLLMDHSSLGPFLKKSGGKTEKRIRELRSRSL